MAGNNKKRKNTDNHHACEDVECKERHKGLKEQLDKKDEVIAKKTKELDQKTKQLAELSSKLESRVRCPICLEVPTAGPLYSCPRGHLVCSTCYLRGSTCYLRGKYGNCPVCSTMMDENTSLLAVTVIENIQHSCNSNGCEVKSPVAEMVEHKRTCGFRIVNCPAMDCKSKVAYKQLMDHILKKCEHSHANDENKCQKVKTSSYVMSFDHDNDSIGNSNGEVETIIWEDKFFFLTTNFNKNDNKTKNIYVQMLGSKDECLKHTVDIEMKGEVDSCRLVFGGHPFPVDMDEGDKEDAGLLIRSKDFNKFCCPVEGKPGKSKLAVALKFK